MARVLLAILPLAGTAYGTPLAVGDPMPALALEDQHGRAGVSQPGDPGALAAEIAPPQP